MAQDNSTCETCGGEGVVIGDAADARGERTDDEQPCPDCRDQDSEYDERDDAERELERDLAYMNFDAPERRPFEFSHYEPETDLCVYRVAGDASPLHAVIRSLFGIDATNPPVTGGAL